MRCERCRRALKRFAVEIPTPQGAIGWGPDCAAYVTIRRSRSGLPLSFSTHPARRSRPRRPNPAQVDWVGFAS